MANISLRKYTNEIARLIEKGQNDEAIAHCRQILNAFPKHIQTYRLLGKAFLETQRYSDAADIFQRVLSSVPDDFVSHVGMGIIREDEGNLEAAVWHMERAYEVQPYNSAIQGELRRLYGRKEGVEPAKIPLTRGALARMYARGDLHQQAIAELRSALAEDLHRPDLQVLLARMYFLSDRKIDAVETCSGLLKKLPFCLEANRILAAVLPETERKEDSLAYSQRVQALDPYLALASPYAPNGDDVPETAVVVEKLDWQPGQAGEPGAPAWATSLGVSFQPFNQNEEKMPEWMGGDEGVEEKISPSQGEEQAEEQTPAEPAQIPDWMKTAGWDASTGEGEAAETAGIFNLESQESDRSEDLAPAEIPEWLRDMAPKPADDEALPAGEADLLPWLQDAPPGPSDTVASWLEETKSSDKPAGDDDLVPAQPASSEDLPDWLKEVGEEDLVEPDLKEEASALSGNGSGFSAEVPDWLEELGEPEESTSSEEVPDWLKDLAREAEAGQSADILPLETTGAAISTGLGEDQDVLEETQAESARLTEAAGEAEAVDAKVETDAEGEEIPDWLQAADMGAELAAESQTGTVTEPVIEDEIPDWLKEQAGEVPEDTLQAGTTEAGPQDGQTELPDWLASAGDISDESIPAPDAERPSWLDEMQQITDEASLEAEAVQTETGPAAEDADIPDWLWELQSSQEAEAAQAGDPVQESPVEEAAPAVPDFDTMDADAAMAWLESLAAKQGVPEEELFSTPEQRAVVQPEWVEEPAEAETPLAESDAGIEPPEQAGIPDWMVAAGAAVFDLDQVARPDEVEAGPLLESEAADWLIDAETEAEPVEMAKPEAGFPDWVKETAATSDGTVEAAEPQPAPQVDLGDTQPVRIKRQETEEPSPAGEAQAEEAKAPEAELAGWLQGVEAGETAEASEAPEETKPEAVEEPTTEPALHIETPPAALEPEEETPDFDLMDADEALAWLESLAAKQGVPEDELITKPDERRETPPEWVLEIPEEPEVQAVVPGADQAESSLSEDVPDWLITAQAEADAIETFQKEALEEPAASQAEQTVSAEVAPVEAGEPDLPAWLQESTAPAEEETPWTPPAVSEAAVEDRPKTPRRSTGRLSGKGDAPVDLNSAPLIEIENLPGIGFILAQNIIGFRETFGPFTRLEDLVKVPGFSSGLLEEIRPYLTIAGPETVAAPAQAAPQEPQRMETEVADADRSAQAKAHNAVVEEQIPEAVELYSGLIRREVLLEEVIEDLKNLVSKRTDNFWLWQTLGDAYVRDNRLQAALDAYIKAEELLR